MSAESVQASMEYGFNMALITLIPARLAGMEDLKDRVPWRSGHESLDAVIEWAVRVFWALAVGMIILSIGVQDWQRADVGAAVTGAALGAMAAVNKPKNRSGP